MRKILIIAGDLEISALLNDTKTAEKIWDVLPFETNGSLWGDEIYFDIPVETESENAKEVVEKGDLAYWPEGSAFCVFFGPTPISNKDEIRPASAVNIIGKIEGDSKTLKKFRAGQTVRIEKAV
jgi:hypothetical protein